MQISIRAQKSYETYGFGTHSYIEGDIGMAMMSSKKITYQANAISGLNLNLRLRFDILQRNFSIAPFYGYNNFISAYSSEKYNEFISIIHRTGLQLNYRIFQYLNEQDQDNSIYTFINSGCSWIDCDLNNSATLKYVNILDDRSLFYGAGFEYRYNKWLYISTFYNIIYFKADYRDQVIDLLRYQGYEINTPEYANFNNLSINIGLELPFQIFFKWYVIIPTFAVTLFTYLSYQSMINNIKENI